MGGGRTICKCLTYGSSARRLAPQPTLAVRIRKPMSKATAPASPTSRATTKQSGPGWRPTKRPASRAARDRNRRARPRNLHASSRHRDEAPGIEWLSPRRDVVTLADSAAGYGCLASGLKEPTGSPRSSSSRITPRASPKAAWSLMPLSFRGRDSGSGLDRPGRGRQSPGRPSATPN